LATNLFIPYPNFNPAERQLVASSKELLRGDHFGLVTVFYSRKPLEEDLLSRGRGDEVGTDWMAPMTYQLVDPASV
jgi:hypothetical protein